MEQILAEEDFPLCSFSEEIPNRLCILRPLNDPDPFVTLFLKSFHETCEPGSGPVLFGASAPWMDEDPRPFPQRALYLLERSESLLQGSTISRI